MSKTFTAPFAQTPKTAIANTTAACVIGSTSAPTNTVLLLTAGSDGAIVTRLWAMPQATVTASSLLLFLSKDSGTTKLLIDSALMTAFTVATTTAIPSTAFTYSETAPLRLEASDRLYVANQVALAAPGVVFRAEYTDF